MTMSTDHAFLNQIINKIDILAAMTLRGVDVQVVLKRTIEDVSSYLINTKNSDPKVFLLTLKNRLTVLADRVDPSMDGYRKVLQEAASLIKL